MVAFGLLFIISQRLGQSCDAQSLHHRGVDRPDHADRGAIFTRKTSFFFIDCVFRNVFKDNARKPHEF